MSAPLTANDVAATCSIPDCARNVHAKGWCGKHYRRAQRTGSPTGTRPIGRPKVDPIETLHKGISVTRTGCWQWSGALNRDGYGVLTVDRKPYRAHRFAYERLVGEIPDGLELDHLCRNRACVRPSHLEPVTPQVNTHRGFGPSGINSRVERCNRGHEFAPENTLWMNSRSRPRPYRRCRTCNVENCRARRRQRCLSN